MISTEEHLQWGPISLEICHAGDRFEMCIRDRTKTNLITVPVGTTLEQAEDILHQHRVEKLLVVDENYDLKGLITVKDLSLIHI